ncbi:MAG: response regulator [Desulfarculus sp.]|nr:response regulator [Desulfarculus sp.]
MSPKILVVDDEPAIRDILTSFFKEFGYEVSAARDGREALSILEQEPIQVMLFDLNMPGMSGLDLCRAIRPKQPQARIFALTGFHRLFTPDSARQAGFDGYLTKPADLHQILDMVRTAFNQLEGNA